MSPHPGAQVPCTPGCAGAYAWLCWSLHPPRRAAPRRACRRWRYFCRPFISHRPLNTLSNTDGLPLTPPTDPHRAANSPIAPNTPQCRRRHLRPHSQRTIAVAPPTITCVTAAAPSRPSVATLTPPLPSPSPSSFSPPRNRVMIKLPSLPLSPRCPPPQPVCSNACHASRRASKTSCARTCNGCNGV